METVVLVGKSPLSLAIARELDRQLGGYPHIRLVWLTSDRNIVILPHQKSALDGYRMLLASKLMEHLRVSQADVKSINLSTKRIVTQKGTLQFDYLLADQTPAYDACELSTIREELLKIVAATAGRLKNQQKAEATVVFEGEDASSWQLAALFAHDVARQKGLWPSLQVRTVGPDEAVNNFLERLAISANKKATGTVLKIAPPQPMINSRQIKGVKIDKSERVVSLFGLLDQYPYAQIYDFEALSYVTLALVQRTIARQIVANVRLSMSGGEPMAQSFGHGLALTSPLGTLVALGGMKNRRLRAKLVLSIDRHFFERLVQQASS